MARRHRAETRELIPDLKYNNKLLARLINDVMVSGKKSIAESIVYGTLEIIKEQRKEDDALEVLVRAIDNIKPKVEVRSRRVGGMTYQVPVEVDAGRQLALAFRWLLQFARARKAVSMQRALAFELLDAFKNEGSAIRKRDETHKMAESNRAFAHFRF